MRPIHYIALIRKMDIGEQYTSEYTKKAYKQRSRARPTLFPSKRRALWHSRHTGWAGTLAHALAHTKVHKKKDA